VTLKLSLNYGVDNGNIVAVGPASCFGSGDLHKGTSGERAAQIVEDLGTGVMGAGRKVLDLAGVTLNHSLACGVAAPKLSRKGGERWEGSVTGSHSVHLLY